jgi:predicted enzyme related to lactoylglutathione lyase
MNTMEDRMGTSSRLRLKATLPMALTVMSTSVMAQSPPQKPAPPDVGSGRVAWFDLTTTDLAKAKEFYGKLFEWTCVPLKETASAVEIVSRGAAIGTLRIAEGAIGPFNGVVYIQVEDIQASVARAKELGGTVVPGFPFNLPDRPGAIAVIMDPTGHPLGMYSRTSLMIRGGDASSDPGP